MTDKNKWGKTDASKMIITTTTAGAKPKVDLGSGINPSNMSKIATLQKQQEATSLKNKKENGTSNAGSRSKFLVGAKPSPSETQQRKGNAGGRSDLIRARESAVAKGTNTFPESGLRLSAYGKSVPAEGTNTLSNDKKKNILREAFDKEETYVDKFKRGNLGGGMANLLGTTLQAPQSLWLNLNNQIASVAQGKGLQPFHYNMDYGDYEGEVAKRAGTVPLGQQISEKNKVLGELYRLGMEMGTDPLTLLDAGGVLKTMGKNIPGSPTQAKELLALKLAEQAEKERRLRALKEGLPRRGEMKISNTKPGNKGNVLGVVNENVKSPRKQGAMQEEGLEKARTLLKERWYNSDRRDGGFTAKNGIEGAGSKWFKADGTPKWPANDGFEGVPSKTTLQPGTKIDRYGSESGKFFAPEGTPYGARSLPPESESSLFNSYKVVKPFDVSGGKIAPWFDQPGGGTQYMSPMTVKELLKHGYIVPR